MSKKVKNTEYKYEQKYLKLILKIVEAAKEEVIFTADDILFFRLYTDRIIENRKHISFIIEELNNMEEITGEKAINFVEKVKERLEERIEEQKWI